jgi:hypothetical protein
MTNNLIPKRRGLLKYSLILAVAGLSTVFTSCMKDNNDTQPQQDIAAISVINASPNSRAINFSLDDKIVNSAGIPYLSGLTYVRAVAGSRKATVLDQVSSKELAKKIFMLNKDTYYSLYVVGVGAGTDSLQYVFTADSLRTPATGKARIRFAHLSPDVASLNVSVEGGATLFTDKAYKSVTPFVEIDPITAKTLILTDKVSGTVVAKLESVTIAAGANYTIFAKGAAAATVNDYKPGIKIINHNNL